MGKNDGEMNDVQLQWIGHKERKLTKGQALRVYSTADGSEANIKQK